MLLCINRLLHSRLTSFTPLWPRQSIPYRNRTKSYGFHSSASACAKPLPPRAKIDDNEIEESFLRGTGPGGQKINKTSSAVQLKHIPTGVVVKCQETRSRSQNRKIARRILAERLEDMEKGSESRRALKARAAQKKKSSADKKKRRKYKTLEEEKTKATREGTSNADVGKTALAASLSEDQKYDAEEDEQDEEDEDDEDDEDNEGEGSGDEDGSLENNQQSDGRNNV